MEEQRQRIVRLRAIGASTDKAEAALEHFKAALSALEYGLDLTQLDLTQLDLTQQARGGARGRRVANLRNRHPLGRFQVAAIFDPT